MIDSTELTFLSAFFAGFLGSTHCIYMCGSINGALIMSLPTQVHQSHIRLWFYLLNYNIGRISSYVTAGVLVGFGGKQILQTLALDNPQMVTTWIVGLFMVALGIHLGGWWQTIAFLERIGAYLWRKLEPVGRYFLPVKHPFQAVGFGLVWGWLPCGLVYSILAFSLASCSAWQGGLLMLAFGLGTLPTSVALGATAPWLTRLAHRHIIRRAIGIVVIIFGLFILLFT